jgi:MSHA biogenesis protein MshI
LFGAGASKAEDWLSVAVYRDRIDVARVERRATGLPVVQLCESYSKKGNDTETLKSMVRSLRPARFRCSNMLEPADYQMQLVEAPSVPAAEVKSAVRWGLKDLLDYAVDAATVDVAPVPKDQSGNARGQYVYAVSARNDRIAERMKLFQAAKFPLEAIDVPEMAQRNVAQLFEQQARGLALLAFDDLGGLLTFTAGGELYMARRTEITAAQLTEVKGEAREQTLDRLVLELQRSLDHFDRQFSYVGVSRMLVAPLAVDLGLDRYLADNLGVPVETLDLSQVLEFTGAPELRDPTRQGYRLHIIGAALRRELAA